MNRLIQRLWAWAVQNYPVPNTAQAADAEWKAQQGERSTPAYVPPRPPATPPAVAQARGEFRQWPPAPDEVEPGVGGGVTPGVSRDQLDVLGNLWLGCPHRPMLGMDNPTQAAVSYTAGRFGWVDVKLPGDLDPDQYYAARYWLREWVEKGEEPRWPERAETAHARSVLERLGPAAVRPTYIAWECPGCKTPHLLRVPPHPTPTAVCVRCQRATNSDPAPTTK